MEAVWVNYTVEKEDGATSEMSSGPLPPSTESFVIENATLGAIYTITVSALNQLGWSGSNITVDTCKHRYYSSLSLEGVAYYVYVLEDTLRMLILFTPLQLTIHSSHLFSQCTKSLATKHDVLIASPLVL